ncbi:uncharacterized protein [Procambarus clarkii]|uniref:uncharacterized protein isoform X1 n=2 Tax=Procambarus clarkii TaxID=6728 RepID=UPI00374428BD
MEATSKRIIRCLHPSYTWWTNLLYYKIRNLFNMIRGEAALMDEEGFPLVLDSRPVADYDVGQFPTDLPKNEDQESGEMTGQQVVVVRRPPENSRIQTDVRILHRNAIRTQLEALQYSVSHRALHLHWNFLSSSPALHLETPRIPFHNVNDSRTSELPIQPTGFRREHELHLERTATRKPFRLQSSYSESKPNKKEVYISIWKEHCRGQLVYDDNAVEWKELKNKCRFWIPFQVVLGDFAIFLPCCLLWLFRLVVVTLKICVPSVGLQMVYYHFLYNHIKIHLIGNERGVEPIFTGAVYQGPMIYSVRYVSCPYCRYKRESKALLKYFDILYQERRDMAVR